MSKRWYCRLEGAVQGPFSLEVLQQLRREGQLKANTPVRLEESAVWQHADEAILAATRSEPAIPPTPPPPPPSAISSTASASKAISSKTSHADNEKRSKVDGPPTPPAISSKLERRPGDADGSAPVETSRLSTRRRRADTTGVWVAMIVGLLGLAVLLAIVLWTTLFSNPGAPPQANKTPTGKAEAVKETPPTNRASTADLSPKTPKISDPPEAPKSPPSVAESAKAKSRKTETAPAPADDSPRDPWSTITRWRSIDTAVVTRQVRIQLGSVWMAKNDYGDPIAAGDFVATPEEEDDDATTDRAEKAPAARKGKRRDKAEYLIVEIKVERLAGGTPVAYRGWNGEPEFAAQAMADDVPLKLFPRSETPNITRFGAESIDPGTTLTDVLVFELPPRGFRKLRIALPWKALDVQMTDPHLGFEVLPDDFGREAGEIGASKSPVVGADPRSKESATETDESEAPPPKKRRDPSKPSKNVLDEI